MNFHNFLSPSQEFRERAWISMLHIGINDTSLLKLTNCSLPPKISDEIKELILDFNKEDAQRKQILTKLINTVLSYTPQNRAEYLWYLQFTVAVILLKELPMSLCVLKGHLLTKTFDIPTTQWDAIPVKIHYFASHLYDLIENDKNLIFVINQMESRNSLGFYLSICMLWKSIYRCINEDKPIFQLYPPSNLIKITEKISAKKLDTNFEDVFNFIQLHSKITTLILNRKERSPGYKCFEEFFVYDVDLIYKLKTFLENITIQAESMFRKDNENLNCTMLIEYLQEDISELDTLTMSLLK